MNLHKEEHEVICQSTAEALFLLMEQKPFSEITIADLVQKAGIARATYYRNYSSKEAVLSSYIDRILYDFGREFPLQDFRGRYEKKYILHILDYIVRYKHQLQILHQSGLSAIYLNRINQYYLQTMTPAQLTAEEKFSIYAFAGAEFNIIFNWLLDDTSLTKNEIVNMIRKYR